jgi:hypothetical protein
VRSIRKDVMSMYREPRNLSLGNLDNTLKTRNVRNNVDSPCEDIPKKDGFDSVDRKKTSFGTSIMNRCKAKELNMFIEKATRMVNHLNSKKAAHSVNLSVGRTHSHSIDNRLSEVIETSQVIPSKFITLSNEKNALTKTFSSASGSHFRTRSSYSKG